MNLKISSLDLQKFERFFQFFNVPSKPIIGVDITSNSIRMVELSKNRKGNITLENYVIENISSKEHHKEFFNDSELNQDLLSAYLQKTFKKLNSNIKNIAISIPSHASIIKSIKLSSDLSDDALVEAIQEEAPQHIPFNLDEIFLDWAINDETKQSSDQEMDVLLFASRSELITNYMAAAEKAGLKVILVDIEQYVKQRAIGHLFKLNPELQESTIAHVDIGSGSCSLHIYQNNNEVYYKEINFGHHQLNEIIQNIYELSPDKADESRKKYGEGLVDFNTRVLNPYLEALSQEINRQIQFFLTQATVDKIDKIYLSGFSASLESASNAVARTTDIPTSSVNPFEQLEISSKAKKKNIDRDAPVLFTAFGLALRQFE